MVELVSARRGPLRRRLCRHRATAPRAGRRAWSRPGVAGAGLPRRSGQGSAQRAAGRVPGRGRGGDGGDHRLRHGHRQARRALRHPRRSAGLDRGLLAGDRPRRPRRRAGRGDHPLRPGRHGLGACAASPAATCPTRCKQVQTRKVRQLYAMLEGMGCRAAAVRRYFGETDVEPCGHCDLCLHPPIAVDVTEARAEGAVGGAPAGRPARPRPARRPPARQDQGAKRVRGGALHLRRRPGVQPRRLARPDRPAAVRGPAASRTPTTAGRCRPGRRRGRARGLPRRARVQLRRMPEAHDATARSGRPRKRRGGVPLAGPEADLGCSTRCAPGAAPRPPARPCRPTSSSTTAPWPTSPA